MGNPQSYRMKNSNSCSKRFRHHTIKGIIEILGICLLTTFIAYGCENHQKNCMECTKDKDFYIQIMGVTFDNIPIPAPSCLSECDKACADSSHSDYNAACRYTKRSERDEIYKKYKNNCLAEIGTPSDILFSCYVACVFYLNTPEYVSSINPETRLKDECCNKVSKISKSNDTPDDSFYGYDNKYKEILNVEKKLKEHEAALKRERKAQEERELKSKTPRGRCELRCDDTYNKNSQSWQYCMMACKDMRND